MNEWLRCMKYELLPRFNFNIGIKTLIGVESLLFFNFINETNLYFFLLEKLNS